MLSIDIGSLIGSWKETGLPVFRAFDWVATGRHGDETGEILILASQAISNPRTDRWSHKLGISTVHQHEGGFVVRNIRMHRANHADIVNHLTHVREKLADL